MWLRAGKSYLHAAVSSIAVLRPSLLFTANLYQKSPIDTVWDSDSVMLHECVSSTLRDLPLSFVSISRFSGTCPVQIFAANLFRF